MMIKVKHHRCGKACSSDAHMRNRLLFVCRDRDVFTEADGMVLCLF